MGGLRKATRDRRPALVLGTRRTVPTFVPLRAGTAPPCVASAPGPRQPYQAPRSHVVTEPSRTWREFRTAAKEPPSQRSIKELE
jgi:hypothetical protein